MYDVLHAVQSPICFLLVVICVLCWSLKVVGVCTFDDRYGIAMVFIYSILCVVQTYRNENLYLDRIGIQSLCIKSQFQGNLSLIEYENGKIKSHHIYRLDL